MEWSWSKHVYSGPNHSCHVPIVYGKNVFTFGGYCDNATFNADGPIDIYVLNTLNLQWSKVKYIQDEETIPPQRHSHTAVIYKNRVYMWGGLANKIIPNHLHLFCLDKRLWLEPDKNSLMPDTLFGHSACVIKNKMYVFGGFNPSTMKQSQELYGLNLDTMMWTTINPDGTDFIPTPRDFHTATAIDDRMYIFGGRHLRTSTNATDEEYYSTKMFYYDTTDNIWDKPPKKSYKPIGRCDHSAFEYKGKLYIFGGYNNKGGLYNSIFQYDPYKFVWMKLHTIGVPPEPRRMQLCINVGNRVFISGGTKLINRPPGILQQYAMQSEDDFIEDINFEDLHVLTIKPAEKDNLSVLEAPPVTKLDPVTKNV